MVRHFRRIAIIIAIPSLITLSGINHAIADINDDILAEIAANQDIGNNVPNISYVADTTIIADPTDPNNPYEELITEANSEEIPVASTAKSKQKSKSQANSYSKPYPNTNPNSKVIKQNMPLTAKDLAAISYQEGMQALEQKQELEATNLFKKSLEEYPKYHKARMQLVEIYKNIGWTDEMEKLLIAGLDLDPNHSDFIKNLALSYQKKGQTRKALSILLAMPDAQAKQVDYMELLALVYLNADQPDIAEKYYQQLVSSNKENSLWWLGLAISQDASGKYMNASESFNQAKQVGRFNTEILDYINNKIKEINKY